MIKVAAGLGRKEKMASLGGTRVRPLVMKEKVLVMGKMTANTSVVLEGMGGVYALEMEMDIP